MSGQTFLGKTAEEWSEIVGEKAESEDRLLLRAEKAEAELARLRKIEAAVQELVNAHAARDKGMTIGLIERLRTLVPESPPDEGETE